MDRLRMAVGRWTAVRRRLLMVVVAAAVTAMLLMRQGGATASAGVTQVAATVTAAAVPIRSELAITVHDGGRWLADGRPFELALTCTAFAVTDVGHLATAAHCVDPQAARRSVLEAVIDRLIDRGQLSAAARDRTLAAAWKGWRLYGPNRVLAPEFAVTAQPAPNLSWPLQLVEARGWADGDVAVLSADRATPFVLPLAEGPTPVGTTVLAIGFPGSTDTVTDPGIPTVKDGIISAAKTRHDGSVPVYEISAALSGGMSGGPTLDLHGRVVGINSFRPSDEPQPFNFITRVSVLSDLLADHGITPTGTDTTTETHRQAVTEFLAGDYTTAADTLDTLIDQVGDIPVLVARRDLARHLADTAPTSVPWLPLTAAAGVIAVVVVTVRRRRGTNHPDGHLPDPAPAPHQPIPAYPPADTDVAPREAA